MDFYWRGAVLFSSSFASNVIVFMGCSWPPCSKISPPGIKLNHRAFKFHH
jgi:hypothetical protein